MPPWRQHPSHLARSPRIPTGAKPPLVKGARRSRGDLAGKEPGAQTFAAQTFGAFFALRAKKAAEPADKPGSVVDSHSSRRRVTAALEQPTRTRRGQRHEVPIWSCSRWGLPYRSVTGLAVRSYRTISPLPACLRRLRRYLSVALSVGSRRPGVTWHLALWSPDFPRHPLASKCAGMTRLSGRLRRAHCRTCGEIVFFPTARPPTHRDSPEDAQPPYKALRGAPVISAASLAAVDGGRCAVSAA